jgi:nicotinamidase-related amidase
MNNSILKKKSALLIVDMQQGVVENAYRLTEVVANISELVDRKD